MKSATEKNRDKLPKALTFFDFYQWVNPNAAFRIIFRANFPIGKLLVRQRNKFINLHRQIFPMGVSVKHANQNRR